MNNTDLNCHSDLVLEFMKIREAAMDFIQARTKSIFLEYPFTVLLFSFILNQDKKAVLHVFPITAP